MKTILYLNGKKAYIKRNGVASNKVNKREFTKLLKDTDNDIDVIVLKGMVVMYFNKLHEFGYILKSVQGYDVISLRCNYVRR